jgi:hypothetical protein
MATKPKKPRISQAELQEFVKLRKAVKRFRLLEASLRERLEAGADVEVGWLFASLEVKHLASPTWSQLIDLLGQACVARLRRRLGLTARTYLRVNEHLVDPT